MKKTLSVGDNILGKSGIAVIKKIELCEKIGDKYGIQIQEVYYDLLPRCVIDCDNGHFEYGYDVDYNPF
tara:strand:- start:12059 stop:12265 length:207 start_codon:yes stop_codon:yes gene_type:complete